MTYNIIVMKRFRGYIFLYSAISALYLILGVLTPTTKPLSQDYQYWEKVENLAPTGKEFVNNFICYSDKKSFLSCINGINLVLHRQFSKKLSPSGEFVNSKEISESKLLVEWEPLFHSRPIDFNNILPKLFSKIDPKEINYSYGLLINGFFSISIDAHTRIQPIKQYDDTLGANKRMALGIRISKSDQGNFYFRKVNKGSLFDSAGIMKDDILVKVNGLETKSMNHKELNIQLLEGSKQNYNLQIKRNNKSMDFVFLNKEIPFSEVSMEIKEKFAVITLDSFSINSCDKVTDYVNEVIDKKIKNIVLDLRDNTGGRMESAKCIANLFLPKDQLIYKTKKFDGKEESFYATKDQVYFDKLSVLVNSSSASSSELLAGTLQDTKRATIIGQRTYGKGSFQEIKRWKSGLYLYETKGLFFSPSGLSPQISGIIPDIPTKSIGKAKREKDLNYSVLPNNHIRLSNETEEIDYKSNDNEMSAFEQTLN